MPTYQITFVQTRIIIAYVNAPDELSAQQEVLRYPNQQDISEELNSKVMILTCEKDDPASPEKD